MCLVESLVLNFGQPNSTTFINFKNRTSPVHSFDPFKINEILCRYTSVYCHYNFVVSILQMKSHVTCIYCNKLVIVIIIIIFIIPTVTTQLVTKTKERGIQSALRLLKLVSSGISRHIMSS